jgi:rare lipoprotein A
MNALTREMKLAFERAIFSFNACAAMTAAHRTLPFGTRLTVCHRGDCVVVRINDRGPFVRGRHIDLSPAAARAIGLEDVGQVSLGR